MLKLKYANGALVRRTGFVCCVVNNSWVQIGCNHGEFMIVDGLLVK